MKKVLVMCIALVLSVSAVIGGTVAYLTDTDSQVNVAVVGNVDIEQLEYQRAEGVAHNAGEAGAGNGVKEGDLVPYVQGQPLYPAFPVNGAATDYTAEATDLFYWGDYVYSGTAGNGLWNDNNLKGAMDKMVFVKNTGSSDCYFRTWLAFECPEGTAYSQGPDKEFMMNVNGSDVYTWTDPVYETIGDTRYLIECATYQNALAAGNTSHPSLLQVVMTHNATNDTVKALGDTYEILTFTQAVQTQNFESVGAEGALNIAFGEKHPWGEPLGASFAVGNDDDLKAALGADKENIVVNLNADVTYDVAAWAANGMGGDSTKSIVINGNGHTVTFNQTNGDWNNIVTKNNAKLVLSNMNITNSGYNDGPWNRHDLNFACEVELVNVNSDKAIALKDGGTLRKVTINDANTSDTYAIWIQPNGQTVTLDGVVIDMLDCTDGRGIKIDEQYVSAPEKVTLNVSNTVFKTEEKSAIIVKSAAGAEINLKNIDISAVAADSNNAVWVDEASAAYADLVVVNGANKIVEP